MKTTTTSAIAAALMAGLLAPCFLSQPNCQAADEPAKPLVVRNVLPSSTDRNIDTFSGDGWEHWVYYKSSAPAKRQLVVFIPGTGGKGDGAKAFNTLAANEGYHVVSLAYPSTVSISVFHESPDPDAFLKARENIIYGKTPYMRLRTNEANSIQNRLVQLLRYLAREFPDEDWSQYLNDKNTVVWDKLVLAGQSQGGGHAALIGMQHQVARVLMFGAPKDYNVRLGAPAKWFSEPSETPLNRFFSFVHSADEHHGCSYAQQLKNYRAMKLSPQYPVINVDDTPAPYWQSRLLTSKRPVENPHGSVIADKTYLETWKYMLKEEVE